MNCFIKRNSGYYPTSNNIYGIWSLYVKNPADPNLVHFVDVSSNYKSLKEALVRWRKLQYSSLQLHRSYTYRYKLPTWERF